MVWARMGLRATSDRHFGALCKLRYDVESRLVELIINQLCCNHGATSATTYYTTSFGGYASQGGTLGGRGTYRTLPHFAPSFLEMGGHQAFDGSGVKPGVQPHFHHQDN